MGGGGAKPLLAPQPPHHSSASFLRPSCLHVLQLPSPGLPTTTPHPPLPPAGVNVLNPHQGPGDPLFIFVNVLAEIARGWGAGGEGGC